MTKASESELEVCEDDGEGSEAGADDPEDEGGRDVAHVALCVLEMV